MKSTAASIIPVLLAARDPISRSPPRVPRRRGNPWASKSLSRPALRESAIEWFHGTGRFRGRSLAERRSIGVFSRSTVEPFISSPGSKRAAISGLAWSSDQRIRSNPPCRFGGGQNATRTVSSWRGWVLEDDARKSIAMSRGFGQDFAWHKKCHNKCSLFGRAPVFEIGEACP